MKLVLDTNVVLDWLVFDDASTRVLAQQIERGLLRWLATQAMRDELERVLAYEHIAARLQARGLLAAGVLERFDRHAVRVDAPERAQAACSDPDDQKFIDLAVRHRCLLLSKDAAVLSMARRLAEVQVCALAVLPGA